MLKHGSPPADTRRPATDDRSPQQFVLDAFDLHEQRLTAYAVRLYGGNLEAARDAVQHTFLQLCQQPASNVKDRLAQWLYTVCRNRFLDDRRAGKVRSQTSDKDLDLLASDASDPAVQFEEREFVVRLRQLFEILREPERDVLDLWSHGFDAAEIARITDQKQGTVRVNLHRAVKRLQQHPDISKWLERATGHVVDPDEDSSITSPLSNRNATPTTSVTGERL